MSKATVSLCVIVLAASGASIYLQSKANDALRRDLAGLREEIRLTNLAVRSAQTKAAQATPLVPASPATGLAPAAATSSEDLAKLRDEISALRKSTTALTQFVQVAQAAQELARTSESIPTKLTPAAELRNAGKATPASTTETALWAAVAGDVDALAGTLMFNGQTKAKADAWFGTLPENVRQQYGSPEKVMALMIARDAASLSGMQVIGQKQITDDDVGVRVRIAGNEGKTKDDTFFMHRTSDGWKMLLPDAAVEKFAKQLSGRK